MGLSREITNVLSACLDCYNCLLCLFMIGTLLNSVKKSFENIHFILICVCLIVFNLSDLSNWISEGNDAAWKVPFLHIMTFIYYAVTPFTFLALINYIKEYVKPKKMSPIYMWSCIILAALYLIFVIATPFTNLFYYFTPDNYYHRGTYNFISTIFFGAFYVLSFIIILVHKKCFTRREFISFMSFPLFPILMEVFQLKFYGLSLVNMGMTLSVLLIFMNLHQNLESSLLQTENEVKTKEKKMIDLQEHTIMSLSNLVENRDTETGEHTKRTQIFIELLARQTMNDGFYTNILDEQFIKRLVKAAPMHDIGKISVSDTILKKDGLLDTNEYEQIKLHAQEGGKIVSDIIGFYDDQEYVQIAVDVAHSHHERWDGTGYPDKLAGEQIPLSARLMAIADVFDALVFERCYKKPIPIEQAFQIIKKESGTHFDPILVSEFSLLQAEIERIVHIYQD